MQTKIEHEVIDMAYVNTALISWIPKKQSTVEMSALGAEFTATKQQIDAIQGIKYKLMMMALPISGPTYVDRNVMLVVYSTTIL